MLALLLKQFVQIRQLAGWRQVTSTVSEARGFKVQTKGSSFAETKGGFYLSREDVAAFEQTGIVGPFDVLSTEDSAALSHRAEDLHENDFDGKILIGNQIAPIMRRAGLWSINYSGMFQALRFPEFAAVLHHPAITHRLASLLGDDLILWRSQFFEKKPGADGTFWHQTGTFRENSKAQKLVPAADTDPSLVQLTAWVALTDSAVANGCLRFLPCSFEDGRFERMAYELFDNQFGALRGLSYEELMNGVWAMKHTTGNFTKAQFLFDVIVKRIPDLFEHAVIEDIEMKAGQCVIFTSMNMHASYPNITATETRLALAGRYTTNDVRVTAVHDGDIFTTPEGDHQFAKDGIGCMQVHGEDRFGHNTILPRPRIG
ncbi:phytanoyl-CoA dioxygenase family protein [Stieleria varia]|uniref:phytanoyl-CoA dioxygenase family protein n=1 Tax=Stieleria varia TaxID=2528005 RepID=UPI0018D23DAA|nr:phytanoyl-CoA dioxygenase family protein [Stieleria varia]